MDIYQKNIEIQKAFLNYMSAALDRGGAGNISDKRIVDKSVLWNEEQILRFITGRASDLFGPSYQDVDLFKHRLRPAQPSFLFLSRILRIKTTQDIIGSFIEAEYDVPENAWYLNGDNMVPALIYLESPSAMLFLLPYIGCDRWFKGQGRFRLFHIEIENSLNLPPKPPFCLKTYIEIEAVFNNKSFYLFNLKVLGYVDYKVVLNAKVKIGLIHRDSLSKVVGVKYKDPKMPVSLAKTEFSPQLVCDKTSFSFDDIKSLQMGNFQECFGPSYTTKKKYPLSCEKFLCIDQILKVDPKGGQWGLGEIHAQKSLDSLQWIMEAHFKDDPVLPGNVTFEGCIQALEFYAYYLGLNRDMIDFTFSLFLIKIKYVKQVLPDDSNLEYKIQIKDIQLTPEPRIMSVGVVICRGYIVTKVEMGLRLIEKKRPEAIQNNFQIPEKQLSFSGRALGNKAFKNAHKLKYAYMAGAMAQGISCEEFVIELGKKGFLGSFGGAGLSLARLEKAVQKLKSALPNGPYAINLIHNPSNPEMEHQTVNMFLKHHIKTIEASAFIRLTPALVHYRAFGLQEDQQGSITINNRIIAKVSRKEVAEQFMKPAPDHLLKMLADRGTISQKQAQMAKMVPMADDITVEADSGGHTDNRPMTCVFPVINSLKDHIQQEFRYHQPLRIGLGGGIGTPSAVAAAFMIGADYVVTGSVNQSAFEAETSEIVKQMLSKAQITDVMMAPSADMFEMGVKVQVLKRETQFPMKAQKLYRIYNKNSSLKDLSSKTLNILESKIFKKPLETVWKETRAFFKERDPKQIKIAEKDPKKKMGLIFKWYLGLSSIWAVSGEKDRVEDYQIWCGPAMGAFNQWAKGTPLENYKNRYVADIAYKLMEEAAVIYRAAPRS